MGKCEKIGYNNSSGGMHVKSFRQQVALFWEAFFQEEKALRHLLDETGNDAKIKQRVRNLLNICLSDCAFACKKNKQGRYELILSPKGDRLTFLYLRYMMEKAPKTLNKVWDFYDTLPKETDADVLKIKDSLVPSVQIQVHPKAAQRHIHLEVYQELFVRMPKNEQMKIMRGILDRCIGELARMYLIGNIRFLKRPKEGGMALPQLDEYITNVVKQERWTHAAHPQRTYFAYAALPRCSEFRLRTDVYGGVSSQLELIHELVRHDEGHVRKAQHNGILVGFLFYEHSHMAKEQRLLNRENLEETISRICAEKQIAENIGAANGLFYTYLDYVVYDWDMFVKEAMPLLEDMDTYLYGFQPMILRAHPMYLVDNRPKGSG